MEQALEPHLQANDLVLGSTVSGEKQQVLYRHLLGLSKHSSAAKAQQVLGEKHWKEWYTFAFVRHPVARMLSLYTYTLTLIGKRPLTAEERSAYDMTGVLPDRPPYKFPSTRGVLAAADFNDFVLNPATWKEAGAQPMWKGICDDNGQLLVKFVGKLEKLPADWATVENALKISAPVGHKNASATRLSAAAPDLSERAWAKLQEECGRDCKMFGYQLRELSVH